MTPWEWLTTPAARIASLGEDPARRVLEVGTTRAMPAHWARTVGMWRVAPRRDIEDTAGVTPETFLMYAARNGLKYRDEDRVLECDLGAHVWGSSLGSTSFQHSIASRAAALGILPVEVVLHRRRAAVMMAALGVETLDDYWAVAPRDDLERAMLWKSAPPLIEIPDDEARPHLPGPAA